MSTVGVGQERSVQVVGLNVRLWEGGTGEPLLVVHHDIGNHGWLPFYETLAERFRVIVPELPGYGRSDRPAWARHPRDLAIILQLLLDRLGIDQAVLVGLGFGGWIAAEMATMSQRRFRRLVLVGAMGIRPSEGEILDQMMVSLADYVQHGFADRETFVRLFGEQVEREQDLAWDYAREMTARIAWKPYMFSHQLPHLLGSVEVPTLIVWGRENRIVPLACCEAFARALPNARLEIVDGAGLWVDMEQPETLATAIKIGNPASWQKAVAARDESGGVIEAVTDEEIVDAYKRVSRLEGIFCEPASAASVAGVIKMQKAGLFKDGDSAVCTLTGHGLKDVDIAISVSQKPATIQANMEDVVRVLGY